MRENNAIDQSVPSIDNNPGERITRCPDCNSILRVDYSCNYVTLSWSLILMIGLTCWVPCVVDGCKKVECKCETCDKIVRVYEPQCC